MKIGKLIILIVAITLLSPLTATAKDIQPAAQLGENRIYIRADGLACYFCAYGLERFFTKSGKIAWYDMDMKKGVVEVGFIKGMPIIGIKTLYQYVYDAGYSPREISARFIGRLTLTPEGYIFLVTETGQSFPVKETGVVKNSQELLGREVMLIARVKEDSKALMLLIPEKIFTEKPEQ